MTDAVKDVYGAALYTDGGTFKSNPGPIGSGIHGYLYNLSDKSISDSKNSKFLFTAKGYLGKENKEAGKLKSYKDVDDYKTVLESSDGKGNLLIAPTHRVNFMISDKGYGTNNQAELIGMKSAMDFINHYNSQYDNRLKYAYIHCDSQYVVQGLNDYLPKWKRRGYKKSDGEDIGNKSEWIALENAYQTALNHCDVKVSWIKGHDGNLGNVHADNLASQAAVLNNSKMGEAVDYSKVIPIGNSILESEVDDVPKGAKGNAATEGSVKAPKKKSNAADSHPFLFSKRLIFNPYLSHQDKGAYTQYFLLEPGDGAEDSFIGAELSDASLVWVRLQEKDPYIDTLIRNQYDWLQRYSCNTDVIVQGFLNKVLSKATKEELDEKGDMCIQGAMDAVHNLFLSDGTPISMVMSPAFLVHRNIQRLDSMTIWANQYLEGRAFGNSVDITPLFYTTEEDKKGNVKMALLPTITNNLDSIKTYALIGYGYREMAYDILTEKDTDTRLVTLTFGIDLPPRNVLKKLERYAPAIYLYTVAKDNNLFEYFVLVHLTVTDEILIMQSTYAADLVV